MKVNNDSAGNSIGNQEKSDHRAAPVDVVEEWSPSGDSDEDREERLLPAPLTPDQPHDGSPSENTPNEFTPVSYQGGTPLAPLSPIPISPVESELHEQPAGPEEPAPVAVNLWGT